MLSKINYSTMKRAVKLYDDHCKEMDPNIHNSPFEVDMKAHRALRDMFTPTCFEDMIDYLQSQLSGDDEYITDKVINTRIGKWNNWVGNRSTRYALKEQSKERYARTFGIYSLWLELLYKELTQ